jgi:hypothetical protein
MKRLMRIEVTWSADGFDWWFRRVYGSALSPIAGEVKEFMETD